MRFFSFCLAYMEIREVSANPEWEIGDTVLSTSWLLWGLLFGSVGLGFFTLWQETAGVGPTDLRARSHGLPVLHFQHLFTGRSWSGADSYSLLCPTLSVPD